MVFVEGQVLTWRTSDLLIELVQGLRGQVGEGSGGGIDLIAGIVGVVPASTTLTGGFLAEANKKWLATVLRRGAGACGLSPPSGKVKRGPNVAA